MPTVDQIIRFILLIIAAAILIWFLFWVIGEIDEENVEAIRTQVVAAVNSMNAGGWIERT